RFLGHVSDMPELLGRVKLCVLSTHYEGLGLGLIEGMVSGCCGIGSDVEGVQEVLTHGETGLLVPHEDAQGLAQTLARCLQDSAGTARVAAAGQLHARAAFDRRRMRRQYLELFSHPPTEKVGTNPPARPDPQAHSSAAFG
ncbi:MAG: glycosyltransferase, partial [Proteobacteria bacterium]|nr:glycosyltransferase [Pseudomonadota bacterium]